MGKGWSAERGGIAGASGLTILELVGGLAVLAVSLTVASPSMASAWRDVRLREAAVRVATALSRARVAALATGRSWRVSVTADGRIVAEPAAGQAGMGLQTRETLPAGVVLAAATSGGSVLFSPMGTAENATFTLTNQGQQRRVVINQRGRITCD